MADDNRGNPNAAENLSEEDRVKGGQASAAKQDMSELGKMTHEEGKPHEFDSEEAREAGKTGDSK